MTGAMWCRWLAPAWMIAAAIAGPAAADPYPIAVLRGLDKVTARISTIEAPIGEAVHFGTLEIVVRTCDKRPPEEPPEAAAFLDIRETRPQQQSTDLFRGWMFASSPALSAMDHPVYDVWVLDCVRTSATAAAAAADRKSAGNVAGRDSAASSRSR